MPNFKDQSPNEVQNPSLHPILLPTRGWAAILFPSSRATAGSVAISEISIPCEIASVALLPRNDIATQPSGESRKDPTTGRRACPVLDRGARGGFTLIEVVVAIAILGIALTVIIELFAGGLRLARTSKEYTKAVNYASTKMGEIDSQKTLEEGVTEGEFDEAFHWRVTTNKVNIVAVERPWEVKVPIQLFKIKVDVLWKSGSKERSTSTETYRTMKVQDDEKKS